MWDETLTVGGEQVRHIPHPPTTKLPIPHPTLTDTPFTLSKFHPGAPGWYRSVKGLSGETPGKMPLDSLGNVTLESSRVNSRVHPGEVAAWKASRLNSRVKSGRSLLCHNTKGAKWICMRQIPIECVSLFSAQLWRARALNACAINTYIRTSAAQEPTREIHPGALSPVWKECHPGVTREIARWITRVISRVDQRERGISYTVGPRLSRHQLSGYFYLGAILQCILSIFHSFPHKILLKTKAKWMNFILCWFYEW